MPNGSPGAVLQIEVRAVRGSRTPPAEAVQQALARARHLLETPADGRLWSPTPGSENSGSLLLDNAAEAFSVLHQLRTELRSDPSRPGVALVSGIAGGDRAEATRLASEALRSISNKKKRFTQALTRISETNTVLSAFCQTLDSLIDGWTDAQWQAIHRRDAGLTLQQIGEELGIAYQNVSKRLIAAQYKLHGEVLGASQLVFSRTLIGRG